MQTTIPTSRSLVRQGVAAAVALALAVAVLPAVVGADDAHAAGAPAVGAAKIADEPTPTAKVVLRWERLRVP